MNNPLNHFGIKTQIIKGDTKSYNNEYHEIELIGDRDNRKYYCHTCKGYVTNFSQKHKLVK